MSAYFMDAFHLHNMNLVFYPSFPWQPFYYPCPLAMPACPYCGCYHPQYPAYPLPYTITYGSNVENNNATPNSVQNQGCPSLSTQGQTNSRSSL